MNNGYNIKYLVLTFLFAMPVCASDNKDKSFTIQQASDFVKGNKVLTGGIAVGTVAAISLASSKKLRNQASAGLEKVKNALSPMAKKVKSFGDSNVTVAEAAIGGGVAFAAYHNWAAIKSFCSVKGLKETFQTSENAYRNIAIGVGALAISSYFVAREIQKQRNQMKQEADKMMADTCPHVPGSC